MKLVLKEDKSKSNNNIRSFDFSSIQPFSYSSQKKISKIEGNPNRKRDVKLSSIKDLTQIQDKKSHHKKLIIISIIGTVSLLITILFLIIHFVIFKINLKINLLFPNYKGNVTAFINNPRKLSKLNISYIDNWYDEDILKNERIQFITEVYEENIKKGNFTFNFKQGAYTLKIFAKNGWRSKTIYKRISVIRNEEIIISALASVMPVTLVTLQLKELTKNYTIPMFVILERRQSWNFSNMPDNINLIHTYNESDFDDNSIDLERLYDRVTEWIRMLQEWYPNLKYTFYLSDEYSFGHLELIYLTNLSSSNFKMYFITSGVTTSRAFNNIYDNTNWEQNYTTYKNKYMKAIEEVQYNNNYNSNNNYYKIGEGFYYILIILDTDSNNNFYWIVNNHKLLGADTIEMPNGIYQSKIERLFNESKIIDASILDMFNSLDENEKLMINNLYHFSKDVFSEAIKNDKNAVILLGRRESIEVYIDYYISLTINFYGNDKYLYYYKGHPNDNSIIEDKKKRLEEKFNVTWLDASIPAEIIYFFTNGMELNGKSLHTYFAGYSSGTFNSISKEYFLCGWEMSYSIESKTSASKFIDNFNFICSQGFKSDNDFGSISAEEGDDGKPKCFIIEYINLKSKLPYTHSVFYFETNKMRHYNMLAQNIFEEYIP